MMHGQQNVKTLYFVQTCILYLFIHLSVVYLIMVLVTRTI